MLDAALKVANEQAGAMQGRRVWLFSSGPLGPPDHLLPEGDPADVESLMETTGALAHRVFAGKLDRSALKLREKVIVGALHAPDGDFRDWDAIRAFGGEIADHLAPPNG